MEKKLYFIDSIYIPMGTKIACVTMFPVDENGEEGEGISIETTTDKIVLDGSKRKKIREGEYYYYDPKAERPFSDGTKSETAKRMEKKWFEMVQEIENSGRIIKGSDAPFNL